MLEIYTSLSRYLFIALSCFFFIISNMLKKAISENYKNNINNYNKLSYSVIIINNFSSFIIIIFNNDILKSSILYIQQFGFFLVSILVINIIYKKSNHLLWNISLYLTSISLPIITRLNYNLGTRQFRMVLIGYSIAFISAILFKYIRLLPKLTPIYIALSYTLLLITNTTINGAQNWFEIGGFSFQPSEFVKITVVFMLASIFSKYKNIKTIFITAIITGGLAIILVMKNDLGTALIFYLVFIFIVYVYAKNIVYLIGGLLLGGFGAYIGYEFFYHVQVRVEAWLNPWKDITNRGYQIAQSLFAIGAGGWLGTGLYNGMPNKIPIVTSDFIFSAICEEFGNIFAIILIFIFLIFVMEIFSMSANIDEDFTFFVSLGLGAAIAIQSFLIIGGVTKIIPLTGVTLPFISYGGTSIIVSGLMMGILQGVYYKAKIQECGEEIDEL